MREKEIEKRLMMREKEIEKRLMMFK